MEKTYTFEFALSVAKNAHLEPTGMISLTKFIHHPENEIDEIKSYELASELARGNEFMRNTLYDTIKRELNLLYLEKAYMKG